MKVYTNLFDKIALPENLFSAWNGFRRGKTSKEDVMLFEKDLERHIFSLARDLDRGTYRHGAYSGFFVFDPKKRNIHKATVRDRVLHHSIMSALYPLFDPLFIHASFSCPIGKGTHKGVEYLWSMLRKESKNNMRNCYALKCDIKKFFDSIDHDVLVECLKARIKDEKVMDLLSGIIESYTSRQSDLFHRCGVPIGNLTSQLFANVYMNEFDQFMKRELKVRHYARYTDDFIVVSRDESYLKNLIIKIEKFLNEQLKLSLHPEKVTIRKYSQGIDFLGYVVFPDHVLLRKRTKRRISRKLDEGIARIREGSMERGKVEAMLQSYLGALSHANAYRFSQDLVNKFWFDQTG